MLSYNMCAFIIFLFSCRIYTNKSRHAGDEKAKKKKKEKKLWQEEAKKGSNQLISFHTLDFYTSYIFLYLFYVDWLLELNIFSSSFFRLLFSLFYDSACVYVFFCALFSVNIFLIWKENIFEKHFFRILFVWNEMRVNQQREREREKNK